LSSRQAFEIVTGMVPAVTEGTVLDFASGKGEMSIVLRQKGYETSACDVAPKKWEGAGRGCVRVDANCRFPFKKGAFDIIICLASVEHFENPWNFVRECHRILKPNGKLIFSTPNVSHIASRLYYLLFGFFPRFTDAYNAKGKATGEGEHITPIFPWTVRRMATGLFTIASVRYDRGFLPLLRLPLPPGLLTGDAAIYELVKE